MVSDLIDVDTESEKQEGPTILKSMVGSAVFNPVCENAGLERRRFAAGIRLFSRQIVVD
jgi:hypothetical protein